MTVREATVMVTDMLSVSNLIKEGHKGICLVAFDVIRTPILKRCESCPILAIFQFISKMGQSMTISFLDFLYLGHILDTFTIFILILAPVCVLGGGHCNSELFNMTFLRQNVAKYTKISMSWSHFVWHFGYLLPIKSGRGCLLEKGFLLE